jgi:hypothetical protein
MEMNGSPVKHEFTGKVAGEAVTGSARLSGARLQGQHEWTARRIAQASTGPRDAVPRIAQSPRTALH